MRHRMLNVRRFVNEGTALESHWCSWFGGALGGTRTPNLLIPSQMLYPLSYERWRPASLRHAWRAR